MVEQRIFNPLVTGSIPVRPTINGNQDFIYCLLLYLYFTRPHRLARSRTLAFHAGDRGSNPLGDAKFFKIILLTISRLFEKIEESMLFFEAFPPKILNSSFL